MSKNLRMVRRPKVSDFSFYFVANHNRFLFCSKIDILSFVVVSSEYKEMPAGILFHLFSLVFRSLSPRFGQRRSQSRPERTAPVPARIAN